MDCEANNKVSDGLGWGQLVGVYGMAGRDPCPLLTQPVHPPCALLLPKLSQTQPTSQR